ncbi:MAG: metal-dependent hydrolase [Firmicutes bacterium]|nr:metal-dependent hydrolase [Bacillota bacterium]
MLWRTHFLAGAAAGLLAGHADAKAAAVSAGIAGIAALLPDIDSPRSKLGRMITPVSWSIKELAGHRGILHSLLGAGVVTLLMSSALWLWYTHTHVFAQMLFPRWYDYGHLVLLIAAGYLSHLVMDSLNPQGVPWLWPYRKHFGLPLAQTGSVIENLVVLPCVFLLFVWLAAKLLSLAAILGKIKGVV